MNRYDKRVRQKEIEDLAVAEATLDVVEAEKVPRPEWVPFSARPLIEKPKLDKKAEAAAAWKLAKNRSVIAVRSAPETTYVHLRQARRGIEVIAVDLWNWVWDPEARLAVASHKRKIRTDPDEKRRDAAKHYRKKKQVVREDTLKRLGIAAAGILTFLLIAWGALFMGGWEARTSFIAVSTLAVYILSKVGQHRRPLAVVSTKAAPKLERVTPELWDMAFHHIGIDGIRIPHGVRAVHGGWEARIKLPVGATYDKVVSGGNPTTLAGNLDINKERLFLDPVRGEDGSERDVVAWIAHKDPMSGPCPDNPLAGRKMKKWNFWDGVPLGLDARGNQVLVPIIFNNVLVGAKPRVGKTFALFQIAAAAALDPDVDLAIISFKTSNDFLDLKPLCRKYIGGGERDPFKELLAFLRQVRAEVDVRNLRLGTEFKERSPEAKLTEDLARDPAAGMRPLVIVIDEFQTALAEGTGPGGDKIGEQIRMACEELARTAPSQGVSLVLAMQRGTRDDLGNLRSYLGTRLALKVEDAEDSKMFLGATHKPGVPGRDASLISEGDDKKGVGIIKGGEDSTLGDRPAFMVKTYFTSKPFLADVAERGLALREDRQPTNVVELRKAGEEETIVAEALAAFEPGEDVLAVSELGRRLGVPHNQIGQRLRHAGIEPEQVQDERRAPAGLGRGAKYVTIEQLQQAA